MVQGIPARMAPRSRASNWWGEYEGAVHRDQAAIRVDPGCDIGYPSGRDARPSQVLLQGPLHAHRLAGQLGEDHGIAFGAIAAKGRAPVLARMIQPANHDLLDRDAQRMGDARAQPLRLRRMSPDGHPAIPADVGDSNEGADRSMPDVRLLVSRGNFFARARQRCSHIGGFPPAFRWRAPLVLAKRRR